MNMIVVVVLAFVMLGLLLTLGRTVMEGAQGGAVEIIGDAEALIKSDLASCDKPLCFSKNNIDVNFNKETSFKVGVKNVNPTTQTYTLGISYFDRLDRIESTTDNFATINTIDTGDPIIENGVVLSSIGDADLKKIIDLLYDDITAVGQVTGAGQQLKNNITQTIAAMSPNDFATRELKPVAGWISLNPSTDNSPEYGAFFWTNAPTTLEPDTAANFNVEYQAPQNDGSYIFQLELTDEGDGAVVDRHQITVRVR